MAGTKGHRPGRLVVAALLRGLPGLPLPVRAQLRESAAAGGDHRREIFESENKAGTRTKAREAVPARCAFNSGPSRGLSKAGSLQRGRTRSLDASALSAGVKAESGSTRCGGTRVGGWGLVGRYFYFFGYRIIYV